jgi:ATP-binding cassette subfamily B (MDR/TAP) protein 1
MPFSLILYGEYTTLLVDRSTPGLNTSITYVLPWFGGGRILMNSSTLEDTKNATLEDAVAFGAGTAIFALVNFIFIAISIQLMNNVAENQITQIRKLFFKSVLRQDMTWYDLNTSENFAVRMTE